MSYSLSLSKSILVVVFIADKARQGMFEFLSTASISENLSIPRPTLVKILQNLHLAGIIETKEGKQGGIRLLLPANRIKVLDIFTAMEMGKPLFQTRFNILAEGKKPDVAIKSIASILEASEQSMKQTLASKTIQNILDEMTN